MRTRISGNTKKSFFNIRLVRREIKDYHVKAAFPKYKIQLENRAHQYNHFNIEQGILVNKWWLFRLTICKINCKAIKIMVLKWKTIGIFRLTIIKQGSNQMKIWSMFIINTVRNKITVCQMNRQIIHYRHCLITTAWNRTQEV